MKMKYIQKQMRQDDKRPKGLDTCEVLVCLVLGFGMNHINNRRVKEFRVLLHYNFRSEQLKGGPNKVELVKAITDLFRKEWGIIVKRQGGGIFVVTNEAGCESGEEKVKKSRFQFSQNIMGWGLGPGDMQIATLVLVKQGGLFNWKPVTLPNFNLLNTLKNILFKTQSDQLM